MEKKHQINDILKKFNIKECSIASVVDGITNSFQFGNITVKTRFQCASISKFVFAILIMILNEKKLIDINETIEYDNLKFKITDLLTHHTGLNLSGFIGYRKKNNLTIKEIINGSKKSNNKRLKKKYKDLKFHYSGGGIILIEDYICNKLNANLGSLLKKYIFIPLNMNNTILDCDEEKYDNIITGHIKLFKRHKIRRYYPENSAAGLWSTPHDLALLGQEILDIIYHNKEGILTKKSIDEMIYRRYEDSFLMEGDICYAGLGCFVKGEAANRFGHSGCNAGYVSLFNISLKKEACSVVMINEQSKKAGQAMNEIEKIIFI